MRGIVAAFVVFLVLTATVKPTDAAAVDHQHGMKNVEGISGAAGAVGRPHPAGPVGWPIWVESGRCPCLRQCGTCYCCIGELRTLA